MVHRFYKKYPYLLHAKKFLDSNLFYWAQRIGLFIVIYLVGFQNGEKSHAMAVYDKCNELIKENYYSGNYTSCTGNPVLFPRFNDTRYMDEYLKSRSYNEKQDDFGDMP